MHLLFVDGLMRVEAVCLLALQFLQIDLYGGFQVLTLCRLGRIVGQLLSHLFYLLLIVVQHCIQLLLLLSPLNLQNMEHTT